MTYSIDRVLSEYTPQCTITAALPSAGLCSLDRDVYNECILYSHSVPLLLSHQQEVFVSTDKNRNNTVSELPMVQENDNAIYDEKSVKEKLWSDKPRDPKKVKVLVRNNGIDLFVFLCIYYIYFSIYMFFYIYYV